jgi:parallel beta-helix repeat protein
MYYRQGYRLDLVGGLEPMHVPWPGYGGSPPNSSDRYRLCDSCHGSGPFTDAGDMNTNFVSEAYDGVQNRHVTHLGGNVATRYPSDWSGLNNSRMNCVACHNVHGSTRLAMVRDGKLTGREPGQKIWYNNDDIVTYSTTNPDPPDPENLPLSASTGVVWIGGSSGNLCSHCHANNNTIPEYRTPFQAVETAPVLSWTGETGYESDGVAPDSGTVEDAFAFRVIYSDANNDAPTAIQLWVDGNDDADFDDPGEKVDMSAVVPADTIYFDGSIFAATVSLGKAGDGTLAYRFYAFDGAEATGPPTAGGTVFIANSTPVLTWAGGSYFAEDGVHPDVGGGGVSYEFRVTYRDADDEAPDPVEVWVDTNDDGDFDDAGERLVMGAAPGGNGDFTDGETYSAVMNLDYVGDGALSYRFQASDGTDFAAGDPEPLDGSVVTVLPSANSPPSLNWAGADCLRDGVRPGTGADGAEFEFMVLYTDPENECPAPASGDIGVWIDEDDSGTYDPGEGYDLEEGDHGDTDCSDGKIYRLSHTLNAAGDGDLFYTFVATDGADSAYGDPTADRTVSVMTATKVRPAGGTGWETSIETAVSNNTGLILVYPNADFTAAVYPQTFIMSKPDRTIRSVCGPHLTVIQGTAYGVKFQTSNNIEIDGFTLTGADRGIEVLGGAPVTVRNCIIRDNSTSGIYAYSDAGLVVADCEIFSNGASAASGGGIYINSGSHSIRDSVIRDNSATINGGGLFLQNAAGGITIEDTSITGNTAPSGGGVNINNSNVTLRRSVISGNSVVNDGGGVYQTNTASVTLENCLLVDNEGNRGGGAFVNGTAILVVNTTVADNRALGGDGGGYYLVCAAITVRNSIFWNNTAAGNGHAVLQSCSTADSILTDSIATTGSAWFYGGTWITGGNIDPARDPMFSGGGDYHLQGNSPAIDAANASYAPAEDIDGDPRPQGGADDIGADEYVP